jgi:hypothetical protein
MQLLLVLVVLEATHLVALVLAELRGVGLFPKALALLAQAVRQLAAILDSETSLQAAVVQEVVTLESWAVLALVAAVVQLIIGEYQVGLLVLLHQLMVFQARVLALVLVHLPQAVQVAMVEMAFQAVVGVLLLVQVHLHK